MHLTPSVPATSRRILLVEDHDDTRTAMTRLLEMNGHRVIDAQDGRSALRIAQAESFELALIDLTLPDMDGIELLARLERAGGRVNAIAVTGHAVESERQRCAAAGFREWMVKPVQIQGLLKLIDAVGDAS